MIQPDYLGQTVGNVIQYFLGGIIGCSHTDTDDHTPGQNTNIVGI